MQSTRSGIKYESDGTASNFGKPIRQANAKAPSIRTIVGLCAIGVTVFSTALATHGIAQSVESTVSGAPQLQAPPKGRLIRASIHASSLGGNLLGDPTEQRVDVYLPPGYDRDTTLRYSVVYMLHGFLGSPDDFTKPSFQRMTVQGAMDTLVHQQRVHEMIIVVPNGRNALGGAFYLNSPVSGNWEDYITRDLVGWVDKTYRTNADAAGRGLAGHSMGGYAALVLGMKHPQLFGAIYAMSPCCVDIPEELGATHPAWTKARGATNAEALYEMMNTGDPWPIHIAASLAVWSPAPGKGPLHIDWPTINAGRFDSAFVSRWRAQLPIVMSDRHVAQLKQLRGIGFDAGFADQYLHIPPTTRALSQHLGEHGVPHSFELYSGDHRNRLGARMSSTILPFFSRHLLPPSNKKTSPNR